MLNDIEFECRYLVLSQRLNCHDVASLRPEIEKQRHLGKKHQFREQQHSEPGVDLPRLNSLATWLVELFKQARFHLAPYPRGNLSISADR